ncbi:MAG: WbqC family protein [Lachnospiraceae bacterium]|nr:WbqC family protein [Lachnospiraceae bacterium]
MILGIMQPYFFPYIGYWQLINCVNKFVLYDDVNYIKGGWINRNRIRINDDIRFFNVPLVGASPNKKINEIQINPNPVLCRKNITTLELAYKKAPYYNDAFPIIYRAVKNNQQMLIDYLYYSICAVCEYLDIKTEIVLSSKLNKNNELKGQDKVIDICKRLSADTYINAAGGQSLYSTDAFKEKGIDLKFIKTEFIEYNYEKFIPGLSIIDMMMYCSKDELKKHLNSHKIIN